MRIQLDGPIDQLERVRSLLGVTDRIVGCDALTEEGHLELTLTELEAEGLLIFAEAIRARTASVEQSGTSSRHD